LRLLSGFHGSWVEVTLRFNTSIRIQVNMRDLTITNNMRDIVIDVCVRATREKQNSESRRGRKPINVKYQDENAGKTIN